MPHLPQMTSYFNKETLVSIMVPEGWTGEIVNDQQFRLFGHPEPEYNDYRPTISYLRGDNEVSGLEWFENLIEESGESLRTGYNEFVLICEERFMLNHFAHAYVRWFEWRDEDSNLQFHQLQALIRSELLYLINAATLKQLRDKHIPIFNSIVRSTRIIAPRSEGTS